MSSLSSDLPNTPKQVLIQTGKSVLIALSIVATFNLLVSQWKSSVQPLEFQILWQGGLAIWLKILIIPIIVLFFADKLDRWFAFNKYEGWGVAFLAIIIIVGTTLKAGLNANFGPTDDHEIVEWLVGRDRVPWAEWPRILMGTDFGSYGSGSSFRPLYFVFRVTECCLYGGNVGWWYATRILLCAGMLFLIWTTCRRFLGATLSFLLIFAIFGLHSTTEIFGRLGVGETWAMPFLVLGVWGMAPLIESVINLNYQGGTRQWWLFRVWIPTFLGFGIIAGIKEAYLPLSCLAWALLIIGFFWTKVSAAKGRIPVVLLTLWALWIVYMGIGVARLVENLGGTDLYGNKVSGFNSIIVAISVGMEGLKATLKVTIPLLLILGVAFVFSGNQKEKAGIFVSKSSRRAAIFYLILAPLAAWFCQALVYRENGWLEGAHYDGPAILIVLISIVALTRLVCRLLSQSSFKSLVDAGRLLHFSLVVALMFSVGSGINRVEANSANNSRMTRDYSSWIESIATEAKAGPSRVIVLVPENAFTHWEPMASTVKFLRSHLVNNTFSYTTEFLVKTGGFSDDLQVILEEGDFGHATRMAPGEYPADAIYVPFGKRALESMNQRGDKPIGKTYDEARW